MGYQKSIILTIYVCTITLCLVSCNSDDNSSQSAPFIADHNVANLSILQSIPSTEIRRAKTDLHIAYGHTSHGSQITDGLNSLVAFMNGLGYESNLYSGLDLHDYYGNFGGSGVNDLGNPDRTSWAQATRNYLNSNPEINVIVWSWCGQVSSATEGDIQTYLSLMESLEAEFPNVDFVYMTGHLDGPDSRVTFISETNRSENIAGRTIRNYLILLILNHIIPMAYISEALIRMMHVTMMAEIGRLNGRVLMLKILTGIHVPLRTASR